MKKIIIKEIYNDDNYIYFDNIKYDIENNFNNDIFLIENRDNAGINDDLIHFIIDNIYNGSVYDLQNYYKNNIASFIIDNLKAYKKLSLKQALKIAGLLKDNNINKENFIINTLNIMFSGDYTITTLRGYSQSDWIRCIYNQKTINYDFIQYIEACIFNTGIEVWISDDLIDDNDIDIDDIENQHEGYYDYMVNYFLLDDKKSYISGMTGYKVDQLKYYEIKDIKTYTTTKVFYKEGL